MMSRDTRTLSHVLSKPVKISNWAPFKKSSCTGLSVRCFSCRVDTLFWVGGQSNSWRVLLVLFPFESGVTLIIIRQKSNVQSLLKSKSPVCMKRLQCLENQDQGVWGHSIWKFSRSRLSANLRWQPHWQCLINLSDVKLLTNTPSCYAVVTPVKVPC